MKTGIVSFAHLHANAYISHLLSMKEVEFIGIYDDDLYDNDPLNFSPPRTIRTGLEFNF